MSEVEVEGLAPMTREELDKALLEEIHSPRVHAYILALESALAAAPPIGPSWKSLMADSVEKANALHELKGKDYGHFSEYPAVVLAALNFVKAKRILELSVKRAADPAAAPVFESLEDSCLDQLNYVRFLYAVLKKKG